ncbi:MAG: 3-oxoadipate enol-lactonase [Deltaproteobacteria bacterium]|nr:3-oxoadipate enol-lactonase [Deltaproteobacteria bacterium]
MRVVANGIVTQYVMEGPAGAPVVTLSHSLAASLEMWEPQIPALATRYRVLRYDTRGHGGSEVPPGPYSLEVLADDALGLLAALGVERTHFVGLSMGGMIGQALALKRPDVLGSLVLADTSCRIPPESGPLWDARIAMAEGQGMAALAEGTLERWFTRPFIERAPEVVDRVRMLVRTTPPQGFAACSQAIRALDYAARLHEIRVPTLIIVGADDQGTPVAASELMHAGIAGSQLVILASAAHLSNIEQAERFNQSVLGFLRSL